MQIIAQGYPLWVVVDTPRGPRTEPVIGWRVDGNLDQPLTPITPSGQVKVNPLGAYRTSPPEVDRNLRDPDKPRPEAAGP